MSSFNLCSLVCAVDLFAKPFQYNLSSTQQTNKTLFGGLISLIIFGISFFYLAYISYLYSNNDLQPNQSSKQIKIQESYNLNITEDLLTFKIILATGENLIDYQNTSGKQLIFTGLQHKYVNDQNQQGLDDYPINPCTSPSLQGYFCIDLSPYNKTSIQMKFNPQNQIADKLIFMVALCSDVYLRQGQTCETNTQLVQSLLFNLSTTMITNIKLSQFNTDTRRIEEISRQELYYFDPQLSFSSKYFLQNNDVTTLDGFIIQNKESNSFIYDFQRIDSYMTTQNYFINTNLNVLGNIIIFLSDTVINTNIQYIPFTALLAQFSSVFNSLLILGFICRKFSMAQIISEFILVELKVKYKQTAILLIDKHFSLSSLRPLEIYKLLQNVNIKQKMKDIFGFGFFRRQFLFLQSSEQQRQRTSKQLNEEKKIFLDLIENEKQNNNIYEVSKKLIEIQMMLKLLFTEEQYAAIKLCGIKIPHKLNMSRDCLIEMQREEEQQQQQFSEKQNYNVDEQQVTLQKQKDYEQKQSQQKEKQDEIENNIKSLVLQTKNKEIDQQEQSSTTRRIRLRSHTESITFMNPIDQRLFNRFKHCTTIIQQDDVLLESSISAIKNHLERIEIIDRDEKYFESLVTKFLEKCQKEPDSITDIDKRIISSVIGFNNENSLNIKDS